MKTLRSITVVVGAFLFPFLLGAHESNVKFTIAELEKAIKKDSEANKGVSEKNLALAYFKDQEQDKAFQIYLKALQDAVIETADQKMGKEEEALYNEAMDIYLKPRQSSVQQVAETIRDLYGEAVSMHPEYYHLGYLVALSYANLNQFDRFFDLFYSSYKRLPDHYLAYKTKAALHIRLFDRAKTPEEKEKERSELLENLQKAKERNPKDLAIYKLEIFFSNDKDKSYLIEKNVSELIEQNRMIPRVDLPFYFDILLAYGHQDLAKKFLQKAREWYPYSRTLDAAEELISRKQKKSLKE